MIPPCYCLTSSDDDVNEVEHDDIEDGVDVYNDVIELLDIDPVVELQQLLRRCSVLTP